MLTTSHAALAATDQEFLKTVIGINLAEIEAGQMAEEKGQTDGVKDFGRMLVDDHMKANQEANQRAMEYDRSKFEQDRDRMILRSSY